MSSPTYQCALYRFKHPDGTSKDWAICIDADVIRIFNAKTGAKMRMTVVPRNSSLNVSLDEEMQARIDSQIKQGYVLVGKACIVDNTIMQLIETNAGTTLHWETTVPVPEQQLIDKIRELAADMGNNPYPGVTTAIENNLLVVITPGGQWAFGYCDSINGGMNRNTGRGGGAIPATYGPIPLLVLHAISIAFPNMFAFADDDGNVVDLRPTSDSSWFTHVPFEKLRKLAVKMGICAPSLTESNVKATGVWF